MESILALTDEEFKSFCNDVIALQNHADSTIGLFATDKPELVKDPQHVLLEIKDLGK